MHHRGFVPRVRPPWFVPLHAIAVGSCLVVTLLLLDPLWAKVESWRQEGPSAFAKFHRENVVISDTGRVRLGHALERVGALNAGRVWDLVRTHDGVLLAATGDSGQVFRRDPKADAPWTVLYDSTDSQVLSLVECPDGSQFAGTGPNGQFVDLRDPKHPLSRPDPKVQYIWGLAAGPQGDVYAATGPNGQLWKRSREGRWSLLYDSKSTHLLCVALGPDGSVYAGSDGEGLIYRVSPDGKTTILFDAPQAEIRTLLMTADGTLYAGTAAELGGPSGARSSLFLTRSGSSSLLDGPSAERADITAVADEAAAIRTAQAGQPTPPVRPQTTRSPQGGSAAPRPVSPGENAVYRLDSDGVPRELLRVKALDSCPGLERRSPLGRDGTRRSALRGHGTGRGDIPSRQAR